MVALLVIIALIVLLIVRSNWRKSPVYFASKVLQKHKREIPSSLLNESFETIPIDKHRRLKISDHWLRIQTGKGKRGENDIWYPKNFICGIYQFNFGLDPEPDFWINFCIITGEERYDLKFYHSDADKFLNSMKTLKSVLPEKAVVETGPVFMEWSSHHKKKIKNYFNQLANEKGMQYLIENRVDFHDLFSMDGIMSDEIHPGTKVDVVLDENASAGTITQGYVERLLHPCDWGDKEGCQVVLKESGKTGRVKKVYGKPRRYDVDIDLPVDDSEEYYKEYPEDRAKDEAEAAAIKGKGLLKPGRTEYKNFVFACVFLTLSTWLLSVVCCVWGSSSEGCLEVFFLSLVVLNFATYYAYGAGSKYWKNYRHSSFHGLMAEGILVLLMTVAWCILRVLLQNMAGGLKKAMTIQSMTAFARTGAAATIIAKIFLSNLTFLLVAGVATVVVLIKFLSVSIRKKKGLTPKAEV